MWPEILRWRGVALLAIAIVATLWLALSNRLILYIHPRYIVFTVVMAGLALVFVLASFLLGRPRQHEEPQGRLRGLLPACNGILALLIGIAMIVVPPATLSSATAVQRDINGSGLGAETSSLAEVATASAGSFRGFSVLDWASLLRQTSDTAFYASKPVDVVGFISADADDPENLFYVSRFVITCCAVDAQPIGLPVYLPGWQQEHALDDWVQVTGEFHANPSSSSEQQIALMPATVTTVAQPSEPYLF